MSTSTIDTDITHYTISEMLQILDMDDLDENEIINKTDKYSDDNSNNPQLSLFFQDMQSQLLEYINSLQDTILIKHCSKAIQINNLKLQIENKK